MQTFHYDNRIVKYFAFATIFWAVTAFFFGLSVATMMFWPELPETLFGTDDGEALSAVQMFYNWIGADALGYTGAFIVFLFILVLAHFGLFKFVSKKLSRGGNNGKWTAVSFIAALFVSLILLFVFWQDFFVYQGMVDHNLLGLTETNGTMGFGRWRMIHTNLAIFGFVGNGFFAGAYYSLQRLLKARMGSDILSYVNFWGWQLILVLMFITYIIGINSSKEYAEAEWPLDIMVALIWVVSGVNMFITIAKRRVRHLYVAIWFFIATFIGIAMLHIFNSLALPINMSLTAPKSYSVYSGVQDALVQWWYGHNAVAFFLTTPILGLMYYFIPKAANRPVFSYKLSIIHFWSLIFVYIWAGPHHLLYTSLPGWAQALGTAFSIMLIAPSWGGMLNGLLTLRGAWDKVREEPVLKFLVVAITCYGMATFEGPLLATKTFNKVGHFTDWVIAHVHVGTLGWNGFMAFGILYWMIPRLYKTKIASKALANWHFWLGTLGIIFYVVPMYVAGWTQGLMWKQFDQYGTLQSTFLETVTVLKTYYYPLRALGGTLYLTGAVLMVFNIWATVRRGSFVANEEAQAPALANIGTARKSGESVHLWIERMPWVLSIMAALVLAIGGLVEIVPTLTVKSNIPEIAEVKPYTPLEVEGRDIYIREGCNACHSQMVRPFRDEVERYGDYSKPGEFVYDHPFLWGSKRTGPDLHRQGGKNDDLWHYQHMLNPRYTSPGSVMPRYPWLIYNKLDRSNTIAKLKTLNTLGVPYTEDELNKEKVFKKMDAQARAIQDSIFAGDEQLKLAYDKEKEKNGDQFVPLKDREITALISYLQRLGTDIKQGETQTASN